ncbi:PAS/PAC sensor signal transduction histidine kinase [Granulicatella balaenopterae]|uniref:histidine kinase n=1 Tax=Granulicatella balaenopterae TaxID=137733 RepID=A0A1H9M9D2_9LACT|nr:cell wall metabolism sensor histidine kinase WalK [Granulicatella balaenopterae]SER20079.1 PAS/PAC sensor signal transduction histidine kinase [Granulicatella balaenopterae]
MKKILKFFRSIHFRIPALFILLLVIALQLVVTNFVRQLEVQTISNFQEQTQLQVGFLKNSVQPILDNDDSEEKKIQMIRQILQDYPAGSNIMDVRIVDAKGYVVGTTNQFAQSIVGTKSTDEDVSQILLSNKPFNYEYASEGVRYWKLVSPIEEPDGTSATPLGVIVILTNIESRYNQVKDIGILFLNASLIAIALTIIVTFLISQGITRPIAAMQLQTEKIAEGNYSGEVVIYSDDELGQLGRAINELSTKIKEAQDASESERQRLDSVLKHMSDGVIATDRRGRIVIMNTAAMDVLNVKSDDEVIGSSILALLDFEDELTFRDLLEIQDSRTLHMSDSDDMDTIIQCEFSVIQRESGFISGLVCVLTDITEQEKIERERRNFVSNVSHELRTPLTSIRSYTEALVDGAWESPEMAPQFLSVIETEANRMMRMITDLLNLSRMDQQRLTLDKEFVNMNKLMNHIIDRFEVVLQSEEYRYKNYRILRDITKRDLWVEIDQDKMTQVFDNIINNAIKYSPDGGRIIVRLMDTHSDLIVSISDEGLGIARKDIPHLFDRFYRVDKARSREMGGSGLGLAIAKEVTQLHGGKIWVTSSEDKGSTFYVSLPYVVFEEDGEWDEI